MKKITIKAKDMEAVSKDPLLDVYKRQECIHKGEEGHPGEPMWNPDLHLIKFITNVEFTDPSYHLPHFYELFALWADEKDRTFWKKAAEASRDYLHLACHEKTGLCAEYADYDGKPHEGDVQWLSLIHL